jgi:hypothetical protein
MNQSHTIRRVIVANVSGNNKGEADMVVNISNMKYHYCKEVRS